ncbi:hypothetical protein H257_11579 [Aphanomyces astaci]|uniref:Clathrin light chain n=1 Tax=Aphanomyces astaci TaxID=112090 RepID=W4G152_APHAT|nr:hypothetical protein H257_11579 [Aphanomyces astaci]ETV73437.1 hypothetical protein H257_11579 [Aphanomyces astaci]|eukprot:XP_009836863.1 hypothetical protein H257_11579 [Aphanomyces astaci]
MDGAAFDQSNAALAEFHAEYERKIAETALEHEKVGEENREKALAAMEQFKTERQRLRDSKVLANRTQEQATVEKLTADLTNENPWERVVSLVELESQKSKTAKRLAVEAKARGEAVDNNKAAADADEVDLTRMKQLFLQLKAEPLDLTRAQANGIASH